MEDVLDLYAEPYSPSRPVVCFDERPVQLLGEVRQPLPPQPGQPQRIDYEYHRNGTCNLFTYFQPLAGWRHVEVTDRRTKQDFAYCMKSLVDVHFPLAKIIRVVNCTPDCHPVNQRDRLASHVCRTGCGWYAALNSPRLVWRKG